MEIPGYPHFNFKCYKIPELGKTIVYCSHQERIPQLDKKKAKVKSLFYFNVIRYIDILYENDKSLTEVCLNFIRECRADPDR